MRRVRWAILILGVPLTLAAGHSPGSPQQPAPQKEAGVEGVFSGLAGATGESDPQVLVDDGGVVYRVWIGNSNGQGGDVRLKRSVDGGRTWPTEAVTLDRGKPEGARSSAAVLATGPGGHVLAAWRMKARERGARKEMQFLGSSDRGATWDGEPRVLNQGGGAMSGEVAAGKDGQVVVAWYDERRTVPPGATRSSRGFKIYVNRSEDFGQTWQPDGTEVSGEAPHEERADKSGGEGARARRRQGFISALPRLQADGRGAVFVAWIDNREGRTEVYFRASTDGGKSWGPEVNVSQGALSATNHQLLTDGEGGLYLVWSDGRDGPDDVFFARSEDAGRHWTSPTRLSRRPRGQTISTWPHMALGGDGRVYVAWQDQRNGREDIYMNISADRGKTWLDHDIRLDRDDPGTGISRTPHVAAGRGNLVAVAWSDDRSGFDQLLLNWSLDGGRTWLDEEVRVDATTADRESARNGQVVWDRAGVLHAVWEVWKGAPQSVQKRVEYRRLALTGDQG